MVNFKSTKLKDTQYATYNLTSFNGVDYTDTPTKVDDTRAIDISNYLPQGNSLRKRHGWEKIKFYYEGQNPISPKNVWKFKDFYILFGTYKNYNITYTGVFYGSSLNGSFSLVKLQSGFVVENGITDYYSWAIEKDNKLLLWCMNKYYILQINTTTSPTSVYANLASDVAYVPTIAIGVQDNNSSASSSSNYEEINMLSNYANIEFWLDFSNGEWTSVSGGYTWSKTGYFDLSNYFANYDNLQLNQIGGANLYQIEQTGWYGVGLLKENGEHSDKIAIFKLDGKNLLYRVYGIQSTSITKVNDPETNINNVSFDLKTYSTQEYQGNKSLKMKFQFNNSNATNTINHMRFGILYGTDKNKDTLFVSGNPNYKNLDIHTNTPKDLSQEDWVTYTYFGDMSYHKIGSSSSAIIGYGINNDSSLTIIKQSLNNEPNVFIRTAKFITEEKTIELSNGTPFKYNNAYALYQVFPSSINIKCKTSEQIIQYDNKVLINAEDGIYYINVNNSTAESSYDSVEASYFIRNDIGNDISDSCFIEYKNQLYICRKDKNEVKRVYVCDRNRYSFYNSKMIYEWWVLDNINAEKMYCFDDELFFTNSTGICKFSENFCDLDKYNFTSISVGNNSSSFVTDLFFDYQKNEMIISSTNEIIQSCKNSNTPKEDYQIFRDNTTIKLNNNIYWVLDDYLDLEQDGLIMKESVADDNIINAIIQALENDNYKLYFNGIEYQGNNNWEYHYEEGKLMGIKFNDELSETGSSVTLNETTQCVLKLGSQTLLELCDLNNGEIDIEKCYYKDGTWVHIEDGVYDELSQNTIFNHFGLKYNNVKINFALDNTFISSASLEFKKPVKAYWLSGYTALGRLDYLKTATNIYFVPDARDGGYTRVGYKTYKKDVGFFSNSKGDTFDFNDIDFDDFTFGQTQFGRTYSSKKKIKNFSFIQMKFYSNENANSTLATCTFRYKYSKNNKGVK